MPLQRLILMRHGQAEDRAASGKDFDRALTARGREDAAETARRLASAGLKPELALVSAALRAVQTWDEAGQAFADVEAEPRRDLYNANPATILDAAEDAGVACVLVVGHNPGLHALAFELAARGAVEADAQRSLSRGFPPAAAAAFRIEPGVTICDLFITPGEEAAG